MSIVHLLQRFRRNLGPNHFSTAESFCYFQAVTSPNPDVMVVINGANGERVGSALYGVSPLNDLVYLYDLRIHPEQRGEGYGLKFLRSLLDKHKLPVVPISEVTSPPLFWRKARARLNREKMMLGSPMSVLDVQKEPLRWAHLAPQIERLNGVIAERLQVEEWSTAVGRGVEDSDLSSY
jgi:hypothetical protein